MIDRGIHFHLEEALGLILRPRRFEEQFEKFDVLHVIRKLKLLYALPKQIPDIFVTEYCTFVLQNDVVVSSLEVGVYWRANEALLQNVY